MAASLAGWCGGQPHACQALLGVRCGWESQLEREPHGESCAGATECPPRVLAWTIERNDRSVLMWYLYRASYS